MSGCVNNAAGVAMRASVCVEWHATHVLARGCGCALAPRGTSTVPRHTTDRVQKPPREQRVWARRSLRAWCSIVVVSVVPGIGAYFA
jgi:hypothetical protein